MTRLALLLTLAASLTDCHPQPTITTIRTVCIADTCWRIVTYSDGRILRWPVEDKP